jgi:hypothetical protein
MCVHTAETMCSCPCWSREQATRWPSTDRTWPAPRWIDCGESAEEGRSESSRK